MKSIFFLFLSLLFIISNETIFDGPKKCNEGYTKRCVAIGPRRSRCYCLKSCKEGEKMECISHYLGLYSRPNCKCVTEN